MQKRINIDISHYKDYSEKFSSIELEIIPVKNKYGPFIKIKDTYKEHFHIYFNENKENEIKSISINENDNVSKINIIIDYQVESFCNLFRQCVCIESIYFKKFFRKNN